MAFDLVLEGGTVVFGDLRKPRKLNIGISGEKITEIGTQPLPGRRKISAAGKFVAPGFIDPHTHSDLSAFFPKKMTGKLFQGVTTEINGNCGIGIFPCRPAYRSEFMSFVGDHFFLPPGNFPVETLQSLGSLRRKWETEGFILNHGWLVGTGCLRIGVAGFSRAELDPRELESMRSLLENELQAGALGVSFGLIYQPGNFISREEILSILRCVGKYDKIACFHIRNEGERVVEAIKEALGYAKESGCKIQISHLKIMDRNLWGRSREILDLLDAAGKEGVRVAFDQYPYTATATNLLVLLPESLFDGDVETLITKIESFTSEEKREIERIAEKRGGPEHILISASFLPENRFSGMTVKEISENLSLSTADTALWLIRESRGRARAIYFSMSEEDMISFMQNPAGLIGSDGSSFPAEEDGDFGIPHPRNFGTFPRFIRMNRELNLFSVEEMIHKITLKPAVTLGIAGRGLIEKDYFADITIFDYEKTRDGGTFSNPWLPNAGITDVIVNGAPALEKGVPTGNRSGRFLP
ncbi:MAG: amidohydrolase family protein [Fusobacteriaceae bacterium]|jgi:N-acyl-D-amino-acid deacylase|nr:amidohydrolase family protein [Fusobacteriaceae bacterium]